MFAKFSHLECRKKSKPSVPGVQPGKKPNGKPVKERVRHNPPPVNHSNKIRQHYTRVQRG